MNLIHYLSYSLLLILLSCHAIDQTSYNTSFITTQTTSRPRVVLAPTIHQGILHDTPGKGVNKSDTIVDLLEDFSFFDPLRISPTNDSIVRASITGIVIDIENNKLYTQSDSLYISYSNINLDHHVVGDSIFVGQRIGKTFTNNPTIGLHLINLKDIQETIWDHTEELEGN